MTLPNYRALTSTRKSRLLNLVKYNTYNFEYEIVKRKLKPTNRSFTWNGSVTDAELNEAYIYLNENYWIIVRSDKTNQGIFMWNKDHDLRDVVKDDAYRCNCLFIGDADDLTQQYTYGKNFKYDGIIIDTLHMALEEILSDMASGQIMQDIDEEN